MESCNIKLGVNVDHVATLRQARGTVYPDIVLAALTCEEAGAHGITVHLREDRRHIQDADVYALRERIGTRLNLEMANTPGILEIALDVGPDEVCLVPEKREELTTEGGLDVVGNYEDLAPTVERLAGQGILVSPFVDPDPVQLDKCSALGVPYVELHTGAFCDAEGDAGVGELTRLIEAAKYAHGLGIKVNAGHGISIESIADILNMPHLDTLNIGHSIIARAVFLGLAGAVSEMLSLMGAYDGGSHD